jgi:hypothetical protein
MRLARWLLVLLAVPGAIFGFLLQVPPHYATDPLFSPPDTTWADVLPLLALVPPIALVLYAIYVVAEWLTSGLRPDRRAKP